MFDGDILSCEMCRISTHMRQSQMDIIESMVYK